MSRPYSDYVRSRRPARSRLSLALVLAVALLLLALAGSGCATSHSTCRPDRTLHHHTSTLFRAADTQAACTAAAGTSVHSHEPASNVLAGIVGFVVRHLPWVP